MVIYGVCMSLRQLVDAKYQITGALHWNDEDIRRICDLEDADEDYYIRLDKKGLKPGAYLPKSREWADGDPTGALLPGTSVLRTDFTYTRSSHVFYLAEAAYFVAGHSLMEGEDYGEIILENAIVIREILPSEIGKDT